MKVLGINSVYHESSAALTIDGHVAAAIEEERLIRYKHGKSASVGTAHLLPINAIQQCLEIACIDISEVDFIAYSFCPQKRSKEFQIDSISLEGDWGSVQGEMIFQQSLSQVQGELIKLFGPLNVRLVWVPHHECHAASTFYPTGWDSAAILVADGIGENASTVIAYGNGPRIRSIKSVHYPYSLGFLWEKMSQYLGFTEYDACKVMGLAAYGDPQRFKEAFEKLACLTNDGFFIDKEIIQYRVPNFQPLEMLFGPRHHTLGQGCIDIAADVAAALQEFTNKSMLHLAEIAHTLTDSNKLCLAGGVALNCVSNFFVKEHSPFEEIYIPPGTHDSGTAIGAALKVHHDRTQTKGSFQLTPYLGPDYDDLDYQVPIHEAGLQPKFTRNIALETARLIAAGKIVAWFQGRMEFGPRALGNRSLLADPRNPEMREILNQKVKHREDFRPFAPSVLASEAHNWFELGQFSHSLKYMLFTCPASPSKRDEIPAVLHVDGTARVQLVYPETNPRYHKLIEEFFNLTEVPILLNTSFNDSEPIICSPKDAVATFMKIRIDILVLGNYIIERDDL